MFYHTVVLKTRRRAIPDGGIKLFVQDLIDRNLTEIDYFGGGLDNQAELISEEMQRNIDSHTYIELHFKTEYELIYISFNDDDAIYNLISHQLENSHHTEFIVDDKDITVNLF